MAVELVYLEVALALPCVIFLWTMVGILKRTGWLEAFWLKSFFSVEFFLESVAYFGFNMG